MLPLVDTSPAAAFGRKPLIPRPYALSCVVPFRLSPTLFFTKAANLAPLCVSRRLLSADAYRNLALARQGGNHVEAGLTFVAEDGDDGDGREEGDGGGNTVAKEGGELAAAAVPGEEAAAGAEMGNDVGGHGSNGGAPKLEPGAGGGGGDSGGGDGGSPEGAEEEEDDLYGDLYGGLENDVGGADMDAVTSGGAGIGNGTRGDGGGAGEDANGGNGGGLDGDGVAEAGAGAGGDGMAEDVSTRAVMNALKVSENQLARHHYFGDVFRQEVVLQVVVWCCFCSR